MNGANPELAGEEGDHLRHADGRQHRHGPVERIRRVEAEQIARREDARAQNEPRVEKDLDASLSHETGARFLEIERNAERDDERRHREHGKPQPKNSVEKAHGRQRRHKELETGDQHQSGNRDEINQTPDRRKRCVLVLQNGLDGLHVLEDGRQVAFLLGILVRHAFSLKVTLYYKVASKHKVAPEILVLTTLDHELHSLYGSNHQQRRLPQPVRRGAPFQGAVTRRPAPFSMISPKRCFSTPTKPSSAKASAVPRFSRCSKGRSSSKCIKKERTSISAPWAAARCSARPPCSLNRRAPRR